jgi:tol-pal system protein YbgF
MKIANWLTILAVGSVSFTAWANPAADSEDAYGYEVFDSHYHPQHQVEEDKPTRSNSKASKSESVDTPPVLLNRIDNLQQQVYQLRGQLEVQTHELQQLKQLQQQQQQHYRNLEVQLEQMAQRDSSTANVAAQGNAVNTGKAVKGKPLALSAQQSSHNPAQEQASYIAAYELVRNKNYPQAIKAMEDFIERYPTSQYAANAHYWLGEVYLAQQQLAESVAEFEIVVEQFPNSTKVAPSMLKLGYAYLGQGDDGKAKQQLRKVQQQFPGSHSARLATTRLQELG